MNLDDLLREMAGEEASDMHIKAGRPPLFRLHGRLVPHGEDALTPPIARDMLFSILTDKQKERLESELYVDLAYSLPGVSRFRVTIYFQRGSLSAVFRRVPFQFPSLDDWNLPEILKEFVNLPQGLVLVTGPTGSGKSSTLASLIRELVDRRPVHVVSIEDPIEFLFSDTLGSISQREIGTDSRSFADALRNTMRQDPDVIMVGEMRDPETMSTVLMAAETGHLVFSTLHTPSAAQTLDRLVGAFPESHHQKIRQQLAGVLEAVVSLKLVDRMDGDGQVAAVEVMRGSPRVRKLILDGNLQELNEEIERSVTYEKMQSLNQSLAALMINGVISQETALSSSPNAADLDLLLRRIVYSLENDAPSPEGEMAVSKADFSHILRLQEIQKAYEELQERYQREVGERDERITQLETELYQNTGQAAGSEDALRAVQEERDKLARQIAFQKQEYESKIEKLHLRVRELSSAAAPAETSRSGIFRR